MKFVALLVLMVGSLVASDVFVCKTYKVGNITLKKDQVFVSELYLEGDKIESVGEKYSLISKEGDSLIYKYIGSNKKYLGIKIYIPKKYDRHTTIKTYRPDYKPILFKCIVIQKWYRWGVSSSIFIKGILFLTKNTFSLLFSKYFMLKNYFYAKTMRK